MKIAVFANTSWYIYNFRMNLIRVLLLEGHEVIVISPEDEYVRKIEELGVAHFNLSLAGSRVNPFYELMTLYQLYKVLGSNKIDLVLSFTPKANIYSAILSLPLKIRVFSNVSGLGRVFIKKSLLTNAVKTMYKFSFVHSDIVFFQNKDDRSYFIAEKMVQEYKVRTLPGSGVDINRFSPDKRKMDQLERDGFVFLLVARVLWDKGVGEYIQAARRIKSNHEKVRFILLGSLGSDNPSAISGKKVESWVKEGVIEYHGPTDAVEDYLTWADCVVLPSYREGTPRSLLEAASMGIPIITTDAIGCRDTVDNGVSGYLCNLQDPDDLAEKMERMMSLSHGDRLAMGKKGREKMVREFDEDIVLSKYLTEIRTIEKQ